MITYKGMENKYKYNKEYLENILNIIKKEEFYSLQQCSKEKIIELLKAIETFTSSIEKIQKEAELQRHETEEEARNYFGREFIKQFDNLLTNLDQEETIVSIHGTNVENCKTILENGLLYTRPSLDSTALQQEMNYGTKDMTYNNYEQLLNWPHRSYKGLVILAIPYECYYKEGLWNHFQETNCSMYGCQDYKIDPEFIVGYIDVENKSIILNPTYKREHNYKNYETDIDIYRENPEMDKKQFKENIISYINSAKEIPEKIDETKEEIEESYEIDIKNLPYVIENLIGTFNSIKNGEKNYMNQTKYNMVMENIETTVKQIASKLPELKTEAEIEKEEKEEQEKFLLTENTNFDDEDWNEFWDENEYESDKSNKEQPSNKSF